MGFWGFGVLGFWGFGVLDGGPNKESYDIMLSTLLQHPGQNTAIEAERLLSEMNSDGDIQPDFASYSKVIQIQLLSPGGRERAVDLAEEAIKEATPASMRDLKAVVLAFCKAGEPSKAEDFLLAICDLAYQGIMPKLDVAAFGAVVSAWERSSLVEAPLRAEKLVGIMSDLHNSGFLERGPDLLTYKALISSWSKSSSRDATKHALAAIEKFRSMAFGTKDEVSIDRAAYNRILYRLAFADEANLADGLLQQMNKDYESRRSATSPNIESYNIVLWALSSEESPDRERIESLLQDMKDKGVAIVPKTRHRLVSAFERLGMSTAMEDLGTDAVAGGGKPSTESSK